MLASRRFHLWFAVVALAGLFAVLAMIVHDRQGRMDRFEAGGVAVVAEVAGRYSEQVSMPEGKLPRTWYFARVRYRAEGRDYRARARVSYEFYESVADGARVEVVYLRDDPATVLIDPVHEARNLGSIWLLGIGFLAVLGVMVWREVQGTKLREAVENQAARAQLAPSPVPGRKPARWKTALSTVLMVLALASFFTASVWLSRAVEAAAIASLGTGLNWLSLPVALAAFLLPPVALGLLNLVLMDLPVGRGRD